jgi:hypothetical protein
MATVKVNPEQLGDAVDKILTEYFDGIETASTRLVSEVAADTVVRLQGTSPRRTGKYAKGWRVKQGKRAKAKNEVEIYNTQYQLTHLLEHGHVKNVHGHVLGFTAARPHIAKAEQEAINRLLKGVEEAAEGK